MLFSNIIIALSIFIHKYLSQRAAPSAAKRFRYHGDRSAGDPHSKGMPTVSAWVINCDLFFFNLFVGKILRLTYASDRKTSSCQGGKSISD